MGRKYEKNYGDYSEILNVKDCTNKAKTGLANLDQGAEREKFLDSLEALRAKLEREGHKLEKRKK